MASSMPAERDSDIGEDRISGLPDDIILSFLSPMGMKEAAQTSIISKRWRYLWATRTHLDFDPFVAFPDTDPETGIYLFTAAQRSKYINWVNQVVGLHCNPCIDTFRVHFVFKRSDAHHFDNWVRFALSKKVKNLELDLGIYKAVCTLGFDTLKLPVQIGDSGIASLTSLHLDHVCVSGDFIEFLLSKCHHLERLYVAESRVLVRLKVIGSSCKLKQLTIHSGCELEELEIVAVNLTYFEYRGANRRANIVFKRLTRLVEATFGGTFFGSIGSNFEQISHIASHIYKLSLDTKGYVFRRGAIPTFCNLKHLNMMVENEERVDMTPLLEACPVLHELKLEVYYREHPVDLEHILLDRIAWFSGYDFEDYLEDNLKDYWDKFEWEQTERRTHPNLKQLHVTSYRGTDYDVDIILLMIRFASNLETIICDTIGSAYFTLYCENEDDILEISRARALTLKKIIPPKISLVIL